jgi:hypothetical protein
VGLWKADSKAMLSLSGASLTRYGRGETEATPPRREVSREEEGGKREGWRYDQGGGLEQGGGSRRERAGRGKERKSGEGVKGLLDLHYCLHYYM